MTEPAEVIAIRRANATAGKEAPWSSYSGGFRFRLSRPPDRAGKGLMLHYLLQIH
ncbi:MAG: hypothetical protein WCJ64_10580 [Rhodospirillaceae bacterium]